MSGPFARLGVGSRLMRHLLAEAHRQGVKTLTSHVSRTARPFYEKFGFSVVEHRSPTVGGIVIPNVVMRRSA